MYINKQTTAKAGFNPNSIKNFINVKTTFKNIFPNKKTYQPLQLKRPNNNKVK